MDTKDVYSQSVKEQKAYAEIDAALLRAIQNGEKRSLAYSVNWAAANINEVVARFAPDAKPVVKGNKMEWLNEKTKIAVVADIGGGYFRIQDVSKPYRCYLDLQGRDVRNYRDDHGKWHGRSKEEQQRLTHFRILFRSEME